MKFSVLKILSYIRTTHVALKLASKKLIMDISDDELEPFQMTGDEFQPRRRKFTKEDRIYGMWAEHDSDEEHSR